MQPKKPENPSAADTAKLPRVKSSRRSTGKEWERDPQTQRTLQGATVAVVLLVIFAAALFIIVKGCQRSAAAAAPGLASSWE